MKKDDIKCETEILGHHGLVSALVDKLELVETIDSFMPKISNNSGLSHGKLIKAMILNGLGFTERRLYMVSHFFSDKPIEKLLGEGMSYQDLNDDQIGRTLDAIYDFGCTELYFYIWSEIAAKLKMLNPFAHLDSTTFSLNGKYDIDENEILVTQGLSKDHRPDLKQVTLNMAVTGKGGIPFWIEPLPGNSSDVVSFHKTIEKFQKLSDALETKYAPIWVSDAALYSRKYLLKGGQTFLWITRVPERIKLARTTVTCSDEVFKWIPIKDGLKYTVIDNIEVEGVKQRWVMAFSEEAYERESITLERNIVKEEERIIKILDGLKNKKFLTKGDADREYREIKKSLVFQCISHKEIVPIYKELRGKTATGRNKKTIAGYQLKLLTYRDQKAIDLKNNSKGRFIIATNFLDKKLLPDLELITEYKNQSKVERGFKFLKDPSFFVSDVYIKNQKRIQSLLFIMALTLMVHNYGQHLIRQKLAENKKTIPNQVNKQISTPTLKWIFQTMRGIIQVRVKMKSNIYESVNNVKDFHQTILDCVGKEALQMYGFS